MSTPQSVRVTFGDDFGRRLEEATQDGRIFSKAGLAKAAYGHAMQHGQAATEQPTDARPRPGVAMTCDFVS